MPAKPAVKCAACGRTLRDDHGKALTDAGRRSTCSARCRTALWRGEKDRGPHLEVNIPPELIEVFLSRIDVDFPPVGFRVDRWAALVEGRLTRLTMLELRDLVDRFPRAARCFGPLPREWEGAGGGPEAGETTPLVG